MAGAGDHEFLAPAAERPFLESALHQWDDEAETVQRMLDLVATIAERHNRAACILDLRPLVRL